MSEITFEFATKDDCLDKMVPSDLRQLVAQRDGLREELAALRESRKADCVEFFHWWWNHDGTNTEQGYDDWAALIQEKPNG